jgi:hypothetical protein
MAFTFEFGEEFIPPYNEMKKITWLSNWLKFDCQVTRLSLRHAWRNLTYTETRQS